VRAWLALAVALLALASPWRAVAHDFSPGVLSLVETTAGRFDLAWTEPVDSQGAPGGVHVAFPPQCRREGVHLDCGTAGLHGEIAFEGMHAARMRVVVAIQRLGAAPEERIVTGAEPRLRLPEGGSGSAAVWLRLGVAHILGGLDHLAFVLGLLLISRPDRRLLWTITAFTLAHSVTLALATQGALRLASAPVEATIAASVVLVAREAMHDQPTLTRRATWAVALLFGLVHGLGFAGALRALGLPSGSVIPALLWFNVGVELGQLGVVAVALLGWRLLRPRLEGVAWIKPAAAYAIGGLGAWWLIARTVAIVQSG
jgi:hypothetical protein